MESQDQKKQEVRDATQRPGTRSVDLVFGGILLLAAVYLVLVVAGLPSGNRLGQTELILIVAVLVLNPVFISMHPCIRYSCQTLPARTGPRPGIALTRPAGLNRKLSLLA